MLHTKRAVKLSGGPGGAPWTGLILIVALVQRSLSLSLRLTLGGKRCIVYKFECFCATLSSLILNETYLLPPPVSPIFTPQLN